MTLEFGFLLFGILTGNTLIVIAYTLLKFTNAIPAEYETVSILILVLFSLAKKFIKLGGV